VQESKEQMPTLFSLWPLCSGLRVLRVKSLPFFSTTNRKSKIGLNTERTETRAQRNSSQSTPHS